LTPSIRDNPFSIRVEQAAQVIPVICSVVCNPAASGDGSEADVFSIADDLSMLLAPFLINYFYVFNTPKGYIKDKKSGLNNELIYLEKIC
jgi:hypothetical protein